MYAHEKKQITRNIKIYYIYMAAFQLIVGPILTLYLLHKGLTFTQIMTLQSIYSVCVFLFEVPTGAVGDLIGRKHSLFLAGIVMALGALCYITGTHFLQFIMGEMLFAAGMSFKSGSDTAILYDSLIKLNRTGDCAKIQGIGQSFFLASQIIGSVISGFIYAINKEFPLIVSAILLVFSAGAALFFYEIKTFEHHEKPSYLQQIKISTQYLISHKRVRAIVAYIVFFFVFYRIGFWYYQPYLKAIHIDEKYFGIVFALYNIVATLSARYSDWYIKRTKGKSLIMVSIFMVTSYLLMGITSIPIGLVFICLQQVTRGVNHPVYMKYINKHIPSNQRATIISLSSLLKNLAASIAFPIVGYAMERIDAVKINLYTGIIMLSGTVFFYFYLNKRMQKAPETVAVE